MWYIFPQFNGLGFSSTSKHFAIKSVEEAEAYLSHPVLGKRLLQCADAALRVQRSTAVEIFGSPDDTKLRSCATLFAIVSPRGSVFEQLLDMQELEPAARQQLLETFGQLLAFQRSDAVA